jgi:hypothetical protein
VTQNCSLARCWPDLYSWCAVHLITCKQINSESPVHLLNMPFLFAGAGYDAVIPDAPNAESHQLTKTLAENIGKLVEQYIDAMEKVS